MTPSANPHWSGSISNATLERSSPVVLASAVAVALPIQITRVRDLASVTDAGRREKRTRKPHPPGGLPSGEDRFQHAGHR